LTAIQACRAASNAWYGCLVTGAAKADHIAIASYVESMKPNSTYFYTTQDADALAGTTGNVFQTLQAAGYTRDIGIYSTTSQAAAAVMGVAMGLNTGLANSAYTLKFQSLTGVTPEPLTQSQVTMIESQNGNVYINYNSEYSILEQGVMSKANTYFDQIINRDMLVNSIQQRLMNTFTSVNKVALNDAGVTSIIHQVSLACQTAVVLGYIGPGIWTGNTILNLSNGNSLPNGYIVQAPAVSTLTSAQLQARQAPPIYVTYIEAGAIHSVTIAVNVQV
jgi:hypothetical protein